MMQKVSREVIPSMSFLHGLVAAEYVDPSLADNPLRISNKDHDIRQFTGCEGSTSVVKAPLIRSTQDDYPRTKGFPPVI